MANPRAGDDRREREREFIRKDGWRLDLASFAYKASQRTSNKGITTVGWRPYPWLKTLARIIAREVKKGGARIIINAPPRSGKSELICHWLPTWFLELWPEKNVISTAYGDRLAHNWGRKVRDEFLTNDKLLTRLRDDAQAVSKWLTTDGGGMLSAGVGGPILGMGGDLMIIDDPHKNWEEASSPVNREMLHSWFKSIFYTRKEPNASIIVTHQRFVESDLTGFLMKEYPGEWLHIRAPALAEASDPIFNRKEGESLIPERISAEEFLKTKRIQGSMLFAGMYEQRPVPLEGGIVKADWLRYWSPDSIPQDAEGEWLQSWDLAFKETKTGSYVVGQVWRRIGARRILMDQVRDRMDFPKMLQAVAMMSNKWPQTVRKGVEEKADGAALLSVLRDKIPGLVAITPRGSKVARLNAVSPYFEAGNVELPLTSTHPWVGDYVEELVTFPNSQYDDQVDTTTQALDMLADKGLLNSGQTYNLDLGWGNKPSINAIGPSGEYDGY